MKRTVIVLATALLLMCLFAATASAAPSSEDLWEKLFGCEGLFPISCPGPMPW